MIYIEDTMPAHPKALAAGGEAMWLWAWGLGYCHQMGSQGTIPKPAVRGCASVSNPIRRARKLVEVGLWEEKGGDFVVHDWYPFNRRADDRRAQARRAAQIRWGAVRDEKASSDPAGAYADAYASADADALPMDDADAMPEHMQEQSGSNACAGARARPCAPAATPTPTPNNSLSSNSDLHAASPAGAEAPVDDEDLGVVGLAVDMVARRRAAAQRPGSVRNERAWLTTTRRDVASEHADRIRAIVGLNPGITPEALADRLEPPAAPVRKARTDPLDETVAAQAERIRRAESAEPETGELTDQEAAKQAIARLREPPEPDHSEEPF